MNFQKKKRFHETADQYRNKLSFIEERIFTIEQAEENAAFTDLLRDSNQVLKDLNSKINMEEIETAKMLQEEAKMNQDQFNNMVGDEEYDQEVEDEYAQLEAEYLKNGLNGVDMMMSKQEHSKIEGVQSVPQPMLIAQ